MTLVLGAVAGGVVYQVSDRLLSRGNLVFDRVSNKAVVVIARDGFFSIGYSGIGYIDGTPTDQVIAELILGIPWQGAMGTTRGLPDSYVVFRRLQDGLARRLGRRFPRYALNLTATGVLLTRRAAARPLVVQMSRDASNPGAFTLDFVVDRHPPADRFWMTVDGSGEMASDLLSSMRLRLRGSRPREGFRSVLIDTVRAVSAQMPSSVGPDVMAILVYVEDGHWVVDTEYVPMVTGDIPEPPERTFTPWLLGPGMSFAPAVSTGGSWDIGNIRFRVRTSFQPTGGRFEWSSQRRRPLA